MENIWNSLEICTFIGLFAHKKYIYGDFVVECKAYWLLVRCLRIQCMEKQKLYFFRFRMKQNQVKTK